MTEAANRKQLEFLRKRSLFIATPCFGGMVYDTYMNSLLKLSGLFIRSGIRFAHSTISNESLVTRARNTLVARFLASDCTHLMFIDADIEFDPAGVLSMMLRDQDIVAGAYPKKGINWQRIYRAAKDGNPPEILHAHQADYVINFHQEIGDDGKPLLPKPRQGLVEVEDAGTGFMLMKRQVIERMIEAYPETKYVNDSNSAADVPEHCYSLFDTMHCPRTNRYLSEDYAFCRRWQQIGGTVLLDLTVKLGHKGSYNFTGSLL